MTGAWHIEEALMTATVLRRDWYFRQIAASLMAARAGISRDPVIMSLPQLEG
jgi:hypothetical protein